jgi:serine/threonine protein kinase
MAVASVMAFPEGFHAVRRAEVARTATKKNAGQNPARSFTLEVSHLSSAAREFRVPTKTADWVGLTLDQRYRVVALLGEGGMGFVLRARDSRLGCDVVLKVPRPEMLADAEFRRRFRDEVAALVRLAHPHIVRVTDYGQHEGTPFAVMPFLPGGSLDDRRPRDAEKRPKPIAAKSLAEWLSPVADALDFIHSQGYIHRDIKPANILFDAHKHPFISDFGVAKAMAGDQRDRKGLTGVGMVLGTPEYLAPEVILGNPFDGRIDQYALAITIYELLTGEVPFTGPTGPAVLVKQTTETAKPLHEVRSTVSPAFSAAIAQAMAKSPAQRFANCAAFAQAVLAGLNSPRVTRTPPGTAVAQPARPTAETPKATATQPMVAPPISLDLTGVTKPNATKPRRKPVILVAWIGAGVLLLSGVGVGIAMLNRSKPTTPPSSSPALVMKDPDSVAKPPIDDVKPAPQKSKSQPPAKTGNAKANTPRPGKAAPKTKPEPPPPSVPTIINAVRITPDKLSLFAGVGTKALTVAIDRTGPANLTVEVTSDAGLTVTPPLKTLSDGVNEASFALFAPTTLNSRTGNITVTVRGADVPHTETIPVAITKLDFRIAEVQPSEFDLQPGDSRDIRVTLDRKGLGGFIEVELEPSAVVARTSVVHLNSLEMTATLQLQVQPSAPIGETNVTIKATARNLGIVVPMTVPLRIFRPLALTATVTTNARHVTAVAMHGRYDGVLKLLSGSVDGAVHSWYRPEPKRRPSEFKWAWTQTEHSRAVTSLSYSSDGRQALSGSLDGTAGLWETHTRNQLIRKLNEKGEWHKSGVWAVFFQPRGPLPAQFGEAAGGTLDSPAPVSISDDLGVLWGGLEGDDALGPKIVTIGGKKKLAKFTPSAPEMTLKNAQTRIGQPAADNYELAGMTGDALSVYHRGRLEAQLSNSGGPLKSMSLSADGKRVCALGKDGMVRVWSVTTKKLLPGFPWKPDGGEVSAATVSPDGSQMLLGSPDGQLKLWKLP